MKSKMNSHLFLLSFSTCLVGCTTGVVPLDQGNYMVAKTSAGGGFATSSGPKAEAYKEANEFCASKGKQVETVSLKAKDGQVFVRSASAELTFRCVAPAQVPES